MTYANAYASQAGHRSSNRGLEWMFAFGMLFAAFILALPGDSLDRSALRPLAYYGLSETSLAILFASVGTLRGVALFANGALPYWGPLMRMIGSLVGVMMWFTLTSLLMYDWLVVGNPPTVHMAIDGMLIGGEIISYYWALRDGRFKFRS